MPLFFRAAITCDNALAQSIAEASLARPVIACIASNRRTDRVMALPPRPSTKGAMVGDGLEPSSGMAAIGIGDAIELGAADAVLPTIADLRLSRFVVPVRSDDNDAPPHRS